jgi:drug/metabolite transporter superfamily protein YnfA
MSFRNDHIGFAVGAVVLVIGCFVTGWEYQEGITETFAVVGFVTMLVVSLVLHARDDAKDGR